MATLSRLGLITPVTDIVVRQHCEHSRRSRRISADLLTGTEPFIALLRLRMLVALVSLVAQFFNAQTLGDVSNVRIVIALKTRYWGIERDQELTCIAGRFIDCSQHLGVNSELQILK